MYQILSNSKTKYGVKEVIADTIKDLDSIPLSTYTPGSTCRIIENSKTYILDSSKHWVIDTSSASQNDVTELITKIVNENNNGSIDTLNEIAQWIINDTAGAAKLANDIAELKKKIDNVDKQIDDKIKALKLESTYEEKGVAKEYTDKAIAAAKEDGDSKYISIEE